MLWREDEREMMKKMELGLNWEWNIYHELAYFDAMNSIRGRKGSDKL